MIIILYAAMVAWGEYTATSQEVQVLWLISFWLFAIHRELWKSNKVQDVK